MLKGINPIVSPELLKALCEMGHGDELGAITVIRHDGSTCDIIRDGRFVLEGVEELNKPLDTLDAESK